jgi:hypothetical protein
MIREVVCVEASDYFPKELRKKYKLGEYAEAQEDTMKAEEAEGVENCSESSDNQ